MDRFIRGALPGRSEERYLGRIIAVEQGDFITVALSTSDGVERGVSDLRWEIIDPSDLNAIQEGVEVVWTVFSRLDEGNRLVSSRVRVMPDGEVSEESRRIIADQLLELWGDE